MNYLKITLFTGILAITVFLSGCATGNAQNSLHMRTVHAARQQVALETSADAAEKVLQRYEQQNASLQYQILERDFAQGAADIAAAPLSEKQRANLIVALYRQYGSQLTRVERELLQDQAKGDQLVANMRIGAQTINALQLAEEIEAAGEVEFADFLGGLIVRSGQQLGSSIEQAAAQKQADDLVNERLRILSGSFEGEEPPEEAPETPETPVEGE